MARDPDRLAAGTDTTGTMSGFLADEDVFDRGALWRLGSWGVAAFCAVLLAIYASQFWIGLRREQVAAVDLAQQAQQITSLAREIQNENRRLASAIETLNGDRDRLYSRVTVLEQGLDSITGAIARQSLAAPASQAAPVPVMAMTEPQPPAAALNPTPAPGLSPVVAAVAKTPEKPAIETAAPEQALAVSSAAQKTSRMAAVAPSAPLVTAKSIMAPPDAAATKLIEPDKAAKAPSATPSPDILASAPAVENIEPDVSAATAPKLAVQRTEFGVDVGGANSLPGLRALWLGLLKSRSNAALTTLRPMIVIREGSNGLGMQLRLVAGPLNDAAAAAKICAGMIENKRPCQTAVFEGLRLAMNAEEQVASSNPELTKPAPARRSGHWRSTAKRVVVEETAAKPDPPSVFSTFFRR
jgi:hypothetical protein